MSGWVHSVAEVGLSGLVHAQDAARALPPAPPAYRHMIDPACYERFEMNCALACTGRVKAHRDTGFPKWAGILILRCGDTAVLRVRGEDPIPLHPGMAIVFDAHRTHAVDQDRTDVLVWLPVYDADEPIDAGLLHARALRKYLPRTATPTAGIPDTTQDGGA